MIFGICTSVANADAVKSAGWDYIEDNVQTLLQGQVPENQWTPPAKASLPIVAANVLVPGALKIVGAEADLLRLTIYMATVLRRAQQAGITKLVFGSGVARMIPDGFDRNRAIQQITDFCTKCASLAVKHAITVVIEPLNKGECNIVNSVAEGMEYVKAVNHPNFQCLVDSYHFWLEDEPLENLKAAMPWIKHVHLADKDGRVAPGLSGKADYRPFFRVLKDGGYNSTISFEGKDMPDFSVTAPKVLEFIKTQWNES
jgi:sugar phosphate isomerase/epimerase